MTGKPKRLMACVCAGVPLVLMIMVGLGLATGPNPHSAISAGHVPLVPVQAPAPAMPMPMLPANAPVYLPRSDPMIVVNQAFPQSIQRLCPPVAASPARASPLPLPRSEPMIAVNQAIPQGVRDPTLPEAVSPGNAPALDRQRNNPITTQRPPALVSPARTPIHLPQIDPAKINMLPFQEGHWQGLEVIPLTKGVARVMKVPLDVKGVIVDDVTSPADMEGFWAGDVITEVGQVHTPNLEEFIKAANRVRDRHRVELQFLRKGKLHSLILTAMQQRLGTANGESAPMIRPGSRPPHGYMGACTNCHHIGTTGQLAVDNGDLLTRAAPPIRAGQTPPHRDRGACTACHTIIP